MNEIKSTISNIQDEQAALRIQEIVDLEPDAMLLVNQATQIILANKRAEQLFGYLNDELCGMTLDALVPEAVRDQHSKDVERYFTNPLPRSMGTGLNIHALGKDGKEFAADISINPLMIGGELLVACAIRDISKQKSIELALREREQTYRALFEYANDAIFLLSLEGVHLQVNQKAADLLGYSREELVGMGVRDIVAPVEYPQAQNKLEILLKSQSLPLYERLFRKKDGNIIPVEINLALIRDSEGEPVFIQSIVRDISERKKTEQEQLRLLEEIKQSREELRALGVRMEQAREEERRLLAIELHDQVGQSLTGLNFNLNIIRSQLPAEADDRIILRLDDSLKLVEDTTHLVRNFMAELHPPMLDDFGLLSALGWYSQNYSQRTGIPTQVSGTEPQPRLPKQVEIVLFRIVQEALNNIAKHAQARQVKIAIQDSLQAVRLQVVDDGVGFNQAEVFSTPAKAHWGLLNMQERAQSVNGSLSIDSALGKGTQISIEIGKRQAYD